jgi:hypothetical protein
MRAYGLLGAALGYLAGRCWDTFWKLYQEGR